jgi:membrane protease YdiL (CAAX protease family)
MHDDIPREHSKPRWQGTLQPGRFLPLRALAWGIFLLVALLFANAFMKGVGRGLGLPGTGPIVLVPQTLGALAVLALYLLGVRLIERRRPDELALARLVPELTAGLALGAALFAAMMGVLLVGGAYALTGPMAAPPWRTLAISVDSGVLEELMFRGVIFRLLWRTSGLWWALALSSALFGASHLINPNPDLMAMLGIIFGAGVPLAALYVLTGRLWASIGCHIAWNFTEGYVFGAQVSGLAFGPSLYQARPVDGVGALWGGGAFGPEASLPTALLGLLAGVAVLAAACARSRV